MFGLECEFDTFGEKKSNLLEHVETQKFVLSTVSK
jgi:hypothetical protein